MPDPTSQPGQHGQSPITAKILDILFGYSQGHPESPFLAEAAVSDDTQVFLKLETLAKGAAETFTAAHAILSASANAFATHPQLSNITQGFRRCLDIVEIYSLQQYVDLIKLFGAVPNTHSNTYYDFQAIAQAHMDATVKRNLDNCESPELSDQQLSQAIQLFRALEKSRFFEGMPDIDPDTATKVDGMYERIRTIQCARLARSRTR